MYIRTQLSIDNSIIF